MIDVKIIKKPKTEGAPSARQTAGTAYGSRTVKEAAHAARADMAELAKVAEKAREADRARDLTPDSPAYNRFLRKDADDKAAGVVDFLKGLRLAGKALTGILTTGDTAGASETNVLSALRALATFLRKDRPDTMPHLLKLLDGVETGTFAAGRTGGRIDRAGNGELGSLTLRDLLTAVRLITGDVRSKNYTPGDMGTGFGLTTGEGGSRLEVDYLLVRRVATFLELLIREMRHVGGTLVLSGASGKVVRVEDKPSAWRVHFKTREDGTTVAHGFTVGAQARCQTYNRTSGNTYYWRLVTAVGDDWVELSKSDYDRAAPTGTARTAPAVGDELVQLGHRTDARQTGAIVLDTVGEGAPSIRLLKDIRSYSITDANVRVLLSPSAVRVIADEVSFASGKTVEQTITESKENAIEAAKDYFKEQKTEIDNSISAVSGKVDNLVIGGRNLLINTQFTKRDSYQTVRGTYHIELDSTERYQGNNSLKLSNTKAGKIYEDVLVSGEQPAAGEYITVSLYAKAATAGTILSVRVCDNGEVQQTATLTTAWQRISFTFHALKAPSRAIGIWYDRADTVWVALPQMEVGNKVTDWSPAPEDVAADAVAKANQALADAKEYTNTTKSALDSSISAAQTAAQTAQKNLDNLTIGGRNLLKYARLISIPATYAYGRGSYAAAVDTATLCEGQRSLKVTASKVGSVGGTDNFVWEAWNVVRQSECVTVSFYAKAATAGTRFSVRMGGDVCNSPQTVSLSTDWQRFEMTFREPGRKWTCIVAWFDRPGTVWIALPKMELGSRATDWSLAPEDVYNEAQLKANGVKKELDSSINAAKTAAQNVQKNLDNLTIGGRNLLRYSALEKTPLNNIVYGRKPENAPVGVEEGYQGAKAVKLVFTTPGKPSVSEVMWRTWEERTDHNRVEPVVLRFWAKADKDNTRMWTLLGYHGGKFARPTISSEWKEYTVNFMPDGPWALWCIGLDAPGTVWISRPKLEYGTKPTDWTPAPEDVDNSIDGVRSTANQASADAGDAKRKAGEAATSASKAESSAKNAEASANAAKGKATEAAGSAKTASDKATNAANSASAAAGSAQTAATNAQNAAGSANAAKADAAKAKADADAAAQSANASKEAADAAKTRLDSWAADNVISPMEKQGLRDETARIDADKSQVAAGYAKYGLGSYQAFTDAYNAYRAVLVTLSSTKQETIAIPADFATKQRNYYTQRSTALTRIADAAKEYVDGLQIGGRNLAAGTSDDWVTILNGPTKTTIAYFRDAQTSSLKKGEHLSVSVEVSWSGLTFGGAGRAVLQAVGDVSGWTKEAIFDDRMSSTVKKSPEGFYRYTMSYPWTEERARNDKFTFSIRLDEATGVFKIRRLMVVRGQKPMDWQPAPEDWVAKINDAKSAGTAAADALTKYKETVSGTFHDGIIQEAEALAIEKYRNIVNSEFGALTNTYNAINGNAYLEGTAKSALANAFNALRAAKDALITSVNNAISDKRVTEGEKQAVDAKYNAYQSAYAAYSAALEVANGSIHAKLKGLADKAANDIQVGGRNLIPDSDNGQLKHFIIHQPNNAPRYSTVDGWWRMAFDRDKQIVSRELTMTSVGTIQGLRKGNLAFSILCRTDGRIVPETLKISFFGGGVHRYVPANIENCGNNTYRIWGVYMNYPVSDLRVPDFMSFSTADATYVEFRYPKLEYGTKPTDWTPAPEDITSEIAAKTEAARQAAQSEAIGLNKWIAQAYYTGENKSATPPKLEDIAGKTPTRTVELKDAQFNLSGNGSVFNMDNYTGIRTTYVYLDADYNLTTGIQHDDAGSLYVNGALVASGGIINTSWKSVTLPLKKGWNRIDGLWNEGGGGDFFKFQAPLENDAHIIQLACRPNVSIDPMRAVTMTTLTEKYSEIAKTNESIKQRVEETEKSIQEVDNKVKGFTTVDKNGQVLIKPDSVWAGVETKVKQLSDESLAKLSVGGRNLIRNSDTSAAPVAMKGPTDGTAYKVFPVKTTLNKHDCQEEEPYTLTVWYTSTSQFPFESFPIGGKPGGDDWSVRFIASEGTITQEGGMKKCVMQAVVPKGGRVLYNPTVGFIYGANSPCNMNLYRVKLERGQKSTDWTPAPEDLPTIDTLTRTGIDIQQGVITLDAQKVKIQNGSQTMAMFEGGKLKADLIDVDKIFSKDITVRNNATITNLRAKNAVIEGKLEAASGSTIGGMTGYSSYLGFEAQRGTASERILRIGTQAIPLSTGFHGMLYLTDKQRDAFKTIVYIESLGKEEKRWNLADARAHNKAIHIASGTLRVDPGNLVDMPGVLLSGRVSETGYVEYEYGRRRMGMGLAAFSVQLHDGRDWVGYTVTHNLGHTNYTVQATPYTPGWNWRKYMVHVDQLTANYFTLLCIDTGTDNRQVKGSFMFTVIGENTAD